MTRFLTDHTGTLHAPAGPSVRIVSLVPSLTELLFDLGLGDQIVGRTRYCVHPAGWIDSVPVVGGTKTVDAGALTSLKATHVVVNVDETPKELADEMAALGSDVIVTHPNSVDDNPSLFRLLGAIFGRVEQAEILCQEFDQALRDLKNAATAMPARRVLYLIWQKPWMTVSSDTYISNTLRLVNWRTLGGAPVVRYPEIKLEDEIDRGADLVLFSSEPFPFTETHRIAFHRQFPHYAGRSAVIDAEMVSWYGSRAIPGLAYLADFAKGLDE